MHKLQCSLRLLPHDNDSGGFFVAVLEKRAATPRDAKEVTEAMLSDEELARLRSDEQLKARASCSLHVTLLSVPLGAARVSACVRRGALCARERGPRSALT